jgi:Synergist-CTERM protein sorting domain-containing protein
LPIRVTYGLSWDEVSDILGDGKVTEINDPKVLFGKLRLAFAGSNGKEYVLVDNGKEGVNVSNASGKALVWKNSNNGLSLTFDIFLSDVSPASDGKPQLIDGYLTAADGAADGSISGSLSLLKTAGGNDGGSGGEEGGGGGCNAGFGIFAVAVITALFFMRENRRARGNF